MAKMAEHCLEGDTAENKTAKISLQLLGWTMYEKWEEVIALCKGLQSFPLSEVRIPPLAFHLSLSCLSF